jgi:Mg2+ and Co2+ transporter CorA
MASILGSERNKIMSTLQTLRESKAERLRSNLVPQEQVEDDEPEMSPYEWFRQWRLEVDERERRDGTFDIEPPTMAEIVAICKEARAERYAEKQKNTGIGKI